MVIPFKFIIPEIFLIFSIFSLLMIGVFLKNSFEYQLPTVSANGSPIEPIACNEFFKILFFSGIKPLSNLKRVTGRYKIVTLYLFSIFSRKL